MNQAKLSLFLSSLLLALPHSFYSSDPVPQTIDTLLVQLTAQRKAKEEAAKAEAETIAAIKALLAADVSKAAAAGITIDPPAPVDPLISAVQAAYTADASTTKAADAKTLATVYREIEDQIASIGTTDMLISTISNITKSKLAGRLPTLTPLLGKDFVQHVPAGSATLTADQKKEVATTLNRYAVILENLK